MFGLSFAMKVDEDGMDEGKQAEHCQTNIHLMAERNKNKQV